MNFSTFVYNRTCVSSTNVPEIRLNRTDPVEIYVAWLLRFEGFICYMDVTTQSTICTICPQGTYANGDNECMYCPEGNEKKIGDRIIQTG